MLAMWLLWIEYAELYMETIDNNIKSKNTNTISVAADYIGTDISNSDNEKQREIFWELGRKNDDQSTLFPAKQ